MAKLVSGGNGLTAEALSTCDCGLWAEDLLP